MNTIDFLHPAILFPAIIAGCVFIVFGFIYIDTKGVEVEYHTGVVVDRNYNPPTSSTGVGYGVTSGGQGAVVTTHSSTPESFALFVRDESGNVDKLTVKMTEFYNKPIGAKIKWSYKRGKISGGRYKITVL
jgi:hypothetical protein